MGSLASCAVDNGAGTAGLKKPRYPSSGRTREKSTEKKERANTPRKIPSPHLRYPNKPAKNRSEFGLNLPRTLLFSSFET